MNSKKESINSLLSKYDNGKIKFCKKLSFKDIGENDVYNISAPFKIKNLQKILGRVEPRETETDTKSVFFKKIKNYWRKDSDSPVLNLQDPFFIKFKKSLFIGGIEIKQKRTGLKYRTVFYSKNKNSLEKLFNGPWGMKGIRITGLHNKIGVFTRPQGKKGGRGKIGFKIFNDLKEITPRKLSNIDIIRNQFARGEWGGVNEIHVLKNNCLGVLGHIAKFSKSNGIKKKFYYPITFMFNPETNQFSGMKIILSRSDLPKGNPKREDLYDVIYPGGLIRNKKKGVCNLYIGVSDSEAYKMTLEDPFLEYENN